MDVENNTTVDEGTVVNNSADTNVSNDTSSSAPDNKEAVDNSLDAVIDRNYEKLTSQFEQKPAEATKVVASAAQTPAAQVVAKKEVDPITGRELEPIKAPLIPIPLRQDWDKLPRQWQDYIAKRESEVGRILTTSGEDRQIAKEFKDVVGQYDGLLRQHGIKAIDRVAALMDVDYKLTQGNPVQRAEIIANLITSLQPDANTLRALLSGQAVRVPPVQGPQKSVDEVVNERLAQRESEQIQNDGKAALQRFESTSPEFLPYVRDIMGKAIEGGLVGGNNFDEFFKNAYEFACRNHPEVAAEIARRNQGAPGQTQQVANTPASKPVQSVKPSLGSGQRSVPPKKKMTEDEAFEFAWKQQGLE